MYRYLGVQIIFLHSVNFLLEKDEKSAGAEI
jgi:hypothetical protein